MPENTSPSLEDDVTAWQTIEKARHGLEWLTKQALLDAQSARAIHEAIGKLGEAKHSINTRRILRDGKAT